jgi:hypothetical protein
LLRVAGEVKKQNDQKRKTGFKYLTEIFKIPGAERITQIQTMKGDYKIHEIWTARWKIQGILIKVIAVNAWTSTSFFRKNTALCLFQVESWYRRSRFELQFSCVSLFHIHISFDVTTGCELVHITISRSLHLTETLLFARFIAFNSTKKWTAKLKMRVWFRLAADWATRKIILPYILSKRSIYVLLNVNIIFLPSLKSECVFTGQKHGFNCQVQR